MPRRDDKLREKYLSGEDAADLASDSLNASPERVVEVVGGDAVWVAFGEEELNQKVSTLGKEILRSQRRC